MTQPMLVCEGLTQTYLSGGRPLTVLNNITFTLERGGFLAIVGPSGSVAPNCATHSVRSNRIDPKSSTCSTKAASRPDLPFGTLCVLVTLMDFRR